MKNMEQEKRFEVVIPPTDVLEQELQDVLGGACAVNRCYNFSCPDFLNLCVNFDETGTCRFAVGETWADCSVDSVFMYGWCMPKKWFDL